MSKRERTEYLRSAARLAEEARVVAGAKKDSGGQRAPVEAADSLRSSQTAQVLDLLSEGEIGGLVNGERSIYLDGVPLKGEDGSHNFQDVAVAWTHGTQGQAALPELSGVQSEVGVGVPVTFATPVVRTVANVNVDTVRVTINVPQISSSDTSTGDINGSSFTWAVEVQSSGGGYVEVFRDTVTGKKMSSYKRARKFQLAGTGPWNVRVRRISADSGSANVVNAFLWDSYTEIQSLKLRYPNSALMMLAVNAQHFNRIPTRAYDVLGIRVRVPSNYDPITRTYSGVWDGTFKVAWTNNPAWIFLELVTNERWGLGGWLQQAGLNAESAKWQLYTISQYCDGTVSDGYGGMEPRFTCNAYIQTREQALQVVQHFAAIFRGAAFWAAGELHITQDAPSDPVSLFTPANVVGGRFSYQTSSDKQRHSVFIVYWNDLSQLGRRTPEVWSPDHLVARFGLKEIEVEPIGITRRGQALRLARWMAYTEEHEGRVIAFKVGSQGALVLPGQVFQVADPSEAGERLGGRIHAATPGQVTLDAPVTLLPGEVYTLTVQLPDPGDQAALITEERAVTNAAGSTSVLNLAAPFSQAPAPQAVWILQSNNIAATTWRCLTCRESDDGTEYEITGLAHDPAKFAAVEQGIVLEPRPVTRLPTQVKPPTSVTLTPQVYQDGQTWRIKLLVSWAPSAAGLQHIVSWRMAQGSWVTLAQTVDQAVDIVGLDAGTVQVEVRAVNALGTVSVPATASAVVASNTTAAAPVVNLAFSIDALGVLVTWEASPDFDWDATELRVGTTWGAAVPIARARATSHRWGWQDNGTYQLLARHIRRSGPQGPVAAINVTVNDAEPLASVLEGLIGPEQLEDFAVNANKLAGGSVDASKLALEIGGGNLVSNGSFEVDSDANGRADSWNQDVGGSTGTLTYSMATAAASVRYGSKAQQVDASALANGASIGVVQTVLGAFAGKKVTFSSWLQASTGRSMRMVLAWFNAAGSHIASTPAAVLSASGQFQRMVATATAPAGAARADFYIYCMNLGSTASTTFFIDGVQLEFGDVATAFAPRPDELLPGSVVNAALADNAVTLSKLAAGAVDATKLAVEIGGGNLLSNSSFEKDVDLDGQADGWLGYSSGSTGTITRTLDTGVSNFVYHQAGQRVTAAALAAGAVNQAGVFQLLVGDTTRFGGKKMVFSCWAAAVSGPTIVVELAWYTAADAFIGVVSVPVAANGQFQRVVAAAATAANAARLRAFVFIRSGNGGPASIIIDGAQLEFGDVATAYAPRPDEILPNTITTVMITDDAVTAPKIVAGAIVAGKIAANAVGATEIAAGSITTAKLLVTGKANTLNADPDCQDASAWLPAPTGTGSGAIVVDAAVRSGNRAWEGSSVSGPVNSFELYSSAVPIDASKNHRVEIDVRSVSGASGAYLLVAFYDANMQVLSGSSYPGGWPSAGSFHYFGLQAAVPPGTYTTYGISFGPGETPQIPPGAKFCRIGALLAYAGTGVNRASNFNLWEKTSGELIVDGAVTAGKIAANAVTANAVAADSVTANKIAAGAVVAGKIAADAVGANQIAAGSVTTNKLVVTGKGMALNDDPGMSDITAWTFGSSGTVTKVTLSDGVAGVTAFRSTGGTTATYSRPFQATAGRQYKVSCYARRTSGTGTIYIRLHCLDAAGSLINFLVTGITPSLTHFDGIAPGVPWVRYVGTIVAGAGVVQARIEFIANYDGGTGVTEVQDLRCEEYIGADVIIDGAIVATKLAANAIAVGTAAIQSGAIVNAHIGNLAVDNAKISALDAAKISTGSLDAARIAAGSLNANKITAGTITTDRIVVGAVTASSGQSATSGSNAFGSPGSATTSGNTADLVFTATGAPVSVHGTFEVNILPANTAIQRVSLSVEVRMDGVVIDAFGQEFLPVFAISGGVIATHTVAFAHRHTPAAGTHNYDIQFSWDLRNSSNSNVTPNGGTWQYSSFLFVQENKV